MLEHAHDAVFTSDLNKKTIDRMKALIEEESARNLVKTGCAGCSLTIAMCSFLTAGVEIMGELVGDVDRDILSINMLANLAAFHNQNCNETNQVVVVVDQEMPVVQNVTKTLN